MVLRSHQSLRRSILTDFITWGPFNTFCKGCSRTETTPDSFNFRLWPDTASAAILHLAAVVCCSSTERKRPVRHEGQVHWAFQLISIRTNWHSRGGSSGQLGLGRLLESAVDVGQSVCISARQRVCTTMDRGYGGTKCATMCREGDSSTVSCHTVPTG
jgi:hypothetical protein